MIFCLWPPIASDAHKGTVAEAVSVEPVADEEALLDTHVADIADAIYSAEGRCDDLHGQSGEYGCYQYQAGTWRSYSTIVAGRVLAQTRANERMVTEGMIRIWLEEGISERGIFLTWNQGNPGPACYRGVNKHGVAYDSCEYADRAMLLLSAGRAARISHELAYR